MIKVTIADNESESFSQYYVAERMKSGCLAIRSGVTNNINMLYAASYWKSYKDHDGKVYENAPLASA